MEKILQNFAEVFFLRYLKQKDFCQRLYWTILPQLVHFTKILQKVWALKMISKHTFLGLLTLKKGKLVKFNQKQPKSLWMKPDIFSIQSAKQKKKCNHSKNTGSQMKNYAHFVADVWSIAEFGLQ